MNIRVPKRNRADPRAAATDAVAASATPPAPFELSARTGRLPMPDLDGSPAGVLTAARRVALRCDGVISGRQTTCRESDCGDWPARPAPAEPAPQYDAEPGVAPRRRESALPPPPAPIDLSVRSV